MAILRWNRWHLTCNALDDVQQHHSAFITRSLPLRTSIARRGKFDCVVSEAPRPRDRPDRGGYIMDDMPKLIYDRIVRYCRAAYLNHLGITLKLATAATAATDWFSIDKITHYGNTITSRAESIHSAVKKDLPSRLLHLHDVWQLLSLYLTRTSKGISHSIGYQRTKVKDAHRKPVLTPIHHHISHYAIDKVLEHCGQFNLFANYETQLPACTKVFSTTMGLPCAHTVQERLRANSTLRIDDFDPQWYLHNPAEQPPIDPMLLLRDPIKSVPAAEMTVERHLESISRLSALEQQLRCCLSKKLHHNLAMTTPR